jgi:hypothetical protein
MGWMPYFELKITVFWGIKSLVASRDADIMVEFEIKTQA